ncbi:MAG: 3,4-dihydroxy-2-butanone-4-phosphate synthase [Myxococcota bacterium]
MNTPSEFMPLHPDPIERVELALADLAAGRMIILVDDEDRENEGDIVLAAERVTPEAINFMATEARGLICLSMTSTHVERLGLPMMATNNQSAFSTAFTVSIEAREGVTTGISAADRAHTVLTAIRPDVSRKDIVTPGHMFPLRARDGGVLERVGQTEGSVDLARMAGLDASAVICEIMNPDGTMARMPDLETFGRTHQMRICTVADIIEYRMRSERIVRIVHQGSLVTDDGTRWMAHLYESPSTSGHHLALTLGRLSGTPTLVRVQPAPPAWSFLGGSGGLSGTARRAMNRIREEGSGALLLMHLQGRGAESLRAAFDSDVGGTSPMPVEASADALRDLGAGCQILRDLGLAQLRLMTNSTRPLHGLEAYGLSLSERTGI